MEEVKPAFRDPSAADKGESKEGQLGVVEMVDYEVTKFDGKHRSYVKIRLTDPVIKGALVQPTSPC